MTVISVGDVGLPELVPVRESTSMYSAGEPAAFRENVYLVVAYQQAYAAPERVSDNRSDGFEFAELQRKMQQSAKVLKGGDRSGSLNDASV